MRGSNFVLAVAVGLYGALVAYGYWGTTHTWGGWFELKRLVYDFQTLVVGVAGLSSIAFLAQQIRLQRKQHQLDIQLAWRAELDALEYVISNCRVLRGHLNSPREIRGTKYVPIIAESDLARVDQVATMGIGSMFRRFNSAVQSHNEAAKKFGETDEIQWEEQAEKWLALAGTFHTAVEKAATDRHQLILNLTTL